MTPDDAITAALRASGGNVSAAARALGVTPRRLSALLWRRPALWPEGVARRRDAALPDAAVTDALRAAEGVVAAAASALGVPRHQIVARLRDHPEVWPADVTHPRDASGTGDAIRAAGGSVAGAARILGVTRQALSARLASHPELWPEGSRPRGGERGSDGRQGECRRRRTRGGAPGWRGGRCKRGLQVRASCAEVAAVVLGLLVGQRRHLGRRRRGDAAGCEGCEKRRSVAREREAGARVVVQPEHPGDVGERVRAGFGEIYETSEGGGVHGGDTTSPPPAAHQRERPASRGKDAGLRGLQRGPPH